MKYKGVNVYPKFSTYSEGGRLAMALMNEDDHQIHGIVTVNIPGARIQNEYCQFVDTNNWGNEIVDWLIYNDFGDLTGYVASSGYCVYPEFKFNKTLIDESGVLKEESNG